MDDKTVTTQHLPNQHHIVFLQGIHVSNAVGIGLSSLRLSVSESSQFRTVCEILSVRFMIALQGEIYDFLLVGHSLKSVLDPS